MTNGTNLDDRLAQLVDAIAQTNKGIEDLTEASRQQKESIQQLAGVVLKGTEDLTEASRQQKESIQQLAGVIRGGKAIA